MDFKESLEIIARQDVEGLIEARRNYGDSWRAEGGFSAYFNVKRKIDRFVVMMAREPLIINRSRDGQPNLTRERYNVFSQILADVAQGGEGTLDAVRDLRRYLTLIEAFLIEEGNELPLQRDNKAVSERAQEELRLAAESLGYTRPEPLGGALIQSVARTVRGEPFGFDVAMDMPIAEPTPEPESGCCGENRTRASTRAHTDWP